MRNGAYFLIALTVFASCSYAWPSYLVRLGTVPALVAVLAASVGMTVALSLIVRLEKRKTISAARKYVSHGVAYLCAAFLLGIVSKAPMVSFIALFGGASIVFGIGLSIRDRFRKPSH